MASGWEQFAVFEGGSVSDLARAQAADGTWHVFAATPVGVFRSVDRGRTWAPLGTGSRVAGAEMVEASPRYAKDGLVYVGAHDGVYRWQEKMSSWTRILTDCYVQDIELDVGDRDARADGSGLTVFVGTQEDGILVSRDGGTSWAGSNVGLIDLCAFDLALSPSFGEDGIAFAATSDGVYRTRNGGEAWRQVDTETEDDEFDAVAVSPTFSEDRLVLASSYTVGLYRSDDAGRSWTHIEEADGWYVTGVDVWSSQRHAACSEMGVGISDDGGQTWRLDWQKQRAQGLHAATSAVLLPAQDGTPEVILAGVAGSGRVAVMRSEDGGANWTPSASGLHAALTSSLLVSPGFADDRTLFAHSLGADLQISTDGGSSWRAVVYEDAVAEDDDDALDDEGHHVRGPESKRLASLSEIGSAGIFASPTGGRVLIGAPTYNLYLSHDDGAHWRRAWEQTPITSATLPHEAIRAIATNASAHILVDIKAGTMAWYLAGSRDGGKTWTELDTPNHDAFVQGLAITPDAGLDGTLYVATEATWNGDFTLWRSVDGGRRWQSWFVNPEVGQHVARPFAALPANRWNDTVVLVQRNQILRPRPNAWEVTGGARRPVWDTVELTDEEPAGRPVSIAGLTVSPGYAQDRTLFAATSVGAYVSRDGGASFTLWSDGLEPAATVAIAVSPTYPADRLVYALGLGGAIWRRPDR